MKSDYQYSASIVYNNFPWPEIPITRRGEANASSASPAFGDDADKGKAEEACFAPTKSQIAIEAAAQAVLNVRGKFMDAPFDSAQGASRGLSGVEARTATQADFYDPLSMPPELVKAHQALDRAVDAAYGRTNFKTEAERVAFLFERYQQLTVPLAAIEATKTAKVRANRKTTKTTL